MSEEGVYRFAARWGEQDAFGHVNNVVYLRYFEEARVQWLRAIGYNANEQLDTGPVILNVNCTYLLPVHYPAQLVVRTRLAAIGTTSFTMQQQLWDEADTTLFTEALIKGVWVRRDTGKSTPLPDFLRHGLQSVLPDSASRGA